MLALRANLTHASYTVSVSATGQVRVEPPLTGEGWAHDVLWLGASQVGEPLPAPLAWVRDVGQLFVTRLCGVPDLEADRGRARLEPPGAELAKLALAVPPMPGAEHVDEARLREWWEELGRAFRSEIERWDGSVEEWLHARSPVWNLVGRVCFHLAENTGDEELPFAFLATYARRVNRRAKVQHVKLGAILEEAARTRDKTQLLSLLVPVEKAAKSSELVRELLDSGDIYEPLAWTPEEALRFLREVPALEAAGVIVRVPDRWKTRRPPRPEVTVTVGGAPPAGVGADALLDFRLHVTLEGEPLDEDDLQALLAAQDGLVRIKGRWVELDSERLKALLEHWQGAEGARKDGLSFAEGVRLLAGAPTAAASDDLVAAGTRVQPGAWMAEVLAGLRAPGAARTPAGLRTDLRPYQAVGVEWLRFATSLRLGVCLADDMGLGKTVQVLALLLILKQRGDGPHLLVVPASLLANWQGEIERFAPALRVGVAHPSAASPATSVAGLDLVITSYGSVSRQAWLGAQDWSLVILDEAQAIKNPGTRQSRAVKALRARTRIALTGTPVENKLGDLWSLFDFLNPGLLGSAKEFNAFAKDLASYAPLRRLIQPYILRRSKTDRTVIADLPEKTELKAYCYLARTQAALYQRAVDDLAHELSLQKQGIQRRGLVLAYLMRFKQICNHPSHWLGDGEWQERDSGKLMRLRELCEDIAARQEKVLVFTQFRETTDPLARFLAEVFGRPGLVLHGGTPVKQRAQLVKRFQEDERVPFFVLSVKAGGTGLNLTAASHVIHFDRWWNPAVEDQATDRAFRIGQQRNVLVHKLLCRGTVEEKIDALISSKQSMSRDLLAGGAETILTELPDDELLRTVALDLRRATGDA